MQRYQDLFEFTPDGYLVTDLFGHIQEANQYAAALLGREREFLIGKPIFNLIAQEDRPAARRKVNQMVTLKRVEHWEVQCQVPKGRSFEAMLTVQTMTNVAGQPEALRWLIRDITALKRLQAEQQQLKLQNMELVESDRLKQQFLANVSHELRTPLNSIIGFSDILQRGLNSPEFDGYQRMARRIHCNGQQLLFLIQDLLDFSYLKSGNPTLRSEPFDVCALVEQVLEELAFLAEQNSLSLRTDLPASLDVVNDPKRLRQVLFNLVNNAIKFTATGEVLVRVRSVAAEEILIEVQDTGVGIAPEHQNNIFREFWQLQQTTTNKSSGTGLGLAIVQAIVRSMAGTIACDSRVGQGTTFAIALPRCLPTQADDSDAS